MLDSPMVAARLLASGRARAAAVRLLACLYQALLDRCPLVVAVAAESPFADDDVRVLLDLVQAALPSRLSQRCRTQWFPQDPELVLGADLADLVVLDLDHPAWPGLAEPPFEVDQDGQPRSGDEPDARLLDYADQVIAAVPARPQWLPAFARRFDALLGNQVNAVPSPDQVALIALVYDLAECFASGAAGASGILRRHLLGPARRGTLPWSDLVGAHEWATLDRADLTALIQTPGGRLDPGERLLRTAAVTALVADGGWQLADASVPWRRSDDPAWWDRLMELLPGAGSLIPPSLLADLGRGRPLDAFPESVLAALLDAELHHGALWRRRFQTAALARAAAVPGVFPILAEGVERGELGGDWCERLLATANDSQLTRAAVEILGDLPDPAPWGRFLLRLVARVAAAAPPALPTLAATALRALGRLAVPRDLDLLMALLDLAARVDQAQCRTGLEPVWALLATLTDVTAQRRLVAAMTAGRCGCLRLAALANDSGQLRLPWMMSADHAAALLADGELSVRLGPDVLLWLAGVGTVEAPLCERTYRVLDDWMRRDPERTAGALIAAGAWRPWRLGAQPLEGARAPLAMLWLTHAAHAPARSLARNPQPGGGALVATRPNPDVPPPAVTIDTWQIVMEDLVAGLAADDIRRLAAPPAHWPWIHPYEQRQIGDLAGRCRDLGALAVLADALVAQGWPLDQDLTRHLIGSSPFAERVSAHAFAWLCAEEAPEPADLPAPTLAESDILCTFGGERLALALRARVAAVIAALASDPAAALAVADHPPLWARADFHAALRRWLPGLSAGPALPDWLNDLERRLTAADPAGDEHAGALAGPPCNDACRALIERLRRVGLMRVASLLARGAEHAFEPEDRCAAVTHAGRVEAMASVAETAPPQIGTGSAVDGAAPCDETRPGATSMSDATAAGGGLWATVMDQYGAGPRQVEIPRAANTGDYCCTLRCMPGADAVHIPIADAHGLCFRCEIPASAGTLVDLRLTPDADHGWVVASTPPHPRVLPAKADDPLPVIPAVLGRSQGLPVGPAPRWEVVLVIDGTARWFEPKATEVHERSGLLLDHPQLWGAARAKLVQLLQALADSPDDAGVRFSVLAFGDHPIPGVEARQLRPDYAICVPAEELRLWPFESARAAAMLGLIKATPGGDFVDALADALARCSGLWSARPDTRKLLVVFGDSPGHSVVHPVSGGDAQVRQADVDLEAAQLHAQGVEIVTLYHRPPVALELPATGKERALIKATAEQYGRLASVRDYALDFADFEPAAVARQLRERAFPIGRGPSYGLIP